MSDEGSAWKAATGYARERVVNHLRDKKAELESARSYVGNALDNEIAAFEAAIALLETTRQP